MSYLITQTFTSILLFILVAMEPQTTCIELPMVYNYLFFGMLITAVITYNFYFTNSFTLSILFYTLHATWILGSVLNGFVDIIMSFTEFMDTECLFMPPLIRVHPFTYIMGSACVLFSSCISRFSPVRASMEGSDNDRNIGADDVLTRGIIDLMIM